ncbi:hypothetical protein [Salisediminibacterium halotolerans]|uniref:hypothetical protein n=2 Tax=Salisediminibacterium halotolerans TaxID=517425 RepID=UPI000EB2745C|nr:hypothetical protein [Salisediminibacterium halotolerans]RLJ69224.1 hypothetical protein BCL39_2719 [Actinophytocola xinjiangensis]RPE87041.1 hypothetical protein EDD67_1905 [Salisediminibacterium halotolerans]TWG32226.1 hypothetical protein BCL52_2714 [Salisediminibacterium halotolerans]GEL09215.1 hypothetical protein SHA02_26310 [Salisediminibacterium halotolerans]
MMRYFWISGAIALILTACQADEESGKNEMSGKISGSPDFFNRLLILKEDQLTGGNIRITPDRHQREDYHTKAYHLFLTDETEIVANDRSYSFDEYEAAEDSETLFFPNQTVNVTTAEEVETTTTELDRYLTFNPALLPVYEAKTIELQPYTLDDFFTYHMPVKDNKFQILTLNISESGEIQAGTDLEGVIEHLASGELADWDTVGISEESPFYDEVTDGPVHAVLNDSEVLLFTDDQNDVIDFFAQR